MKIAFSPAGYSKLPRIRTDDGTGEFFYQAMRIEESTKLEKLLISHDELHTICKVLMGLLLVNGLQLELDAELSKANIEPGFAGRAEEIEGDFRRERRALIAHGTIQ